LEGRIYYIWRRRKREVRIYYRKHPHFLGGWGRRRGANGEEFLLNKGNRRTEDNG